MPDDHSTYRKCPVCGGTISAVGTVMALSAETVIARYLDGPPKGVPDDALDVDRIADPCGHRLTLIQLREAGIEVERYEHPA